MKPKNLAAPFSWQERRVLLQENTLFVPDYYQSYDEFTFPGWSNTAIFGNDNPVYIEYCSGNGLWISEKAQQDTTSNWVAIEKRFDRVRKIWSKTQNLGIENMFIMCGFAQTITEQYIPDNSVDGIFINFPDPWPKDKHAKHRLIQSPFVRDMYRILKPGGSLVIVTDDDGYRDWILSVMDYHPYFIADTTNDMDIKTYGESYFSDLWQSLNRNIHFLRYIGQKNVC